MCFIFIPSLFIQIFNSIKALILLLIHQQGTFSAVLPDIVLLAAVTVVTLIAGRFFCGWMCAFGSMGDFLYQLLFENTISMKIRALYDVKQWTDLLNYFLTALSIVLF